MEVAELYQIDIRKARKVHKCADCLGVIPVGEKYHFHHGICEGRTFSHKSCADCEQMRNDLNAGEPVDECICVGELVDAVFDLNVKLIAQYVGYATKRGGYVRPWMKDRIEGGLKKLNSFNQGSL